MNMAASGKHLGIGVSILATIGAGAVLMFVFDPDRGSDRRSRIAKSIHDLRESAGSLGHQLRDHAGHLADHASETVGNVHSALHSRARAGIAAAQRAREAAEKPIRDHYQHTPVAGYTITAAGALAVGAAAVLLADEKRRNHLFSAAGETISGAGKSFRYFGKLIRSGLEQVASCQHQSRSSSGNERNARQPQQNRPAGLPGGAGNSSRPMASGPGAPAATPL
jgi:gas vesicle protein